MFKLSKILLITSYILCFKNIAYSANNNQVETQINANKILNSIISNQLQKQNDFDNEEIKLNQGYITSNDKNDELNDNKNEKDLNISPSNFDLSISDENIYDAELAKLGKDAALAYEIGHIEVSTSLYKKILNKIPNDRNALFGLATIYHIEKQFNEARSLYTQLLKLEPDNNIALNNFLALTGEESPQETIAELKKFESINPQNSFIPAQIAIIYNNIGDNQKAIKYFHKAILISPENLTYRYNLAVILDQMGEKEKSIEIYKQILRESYRDASYDNNYNQVIEKRLRFLNSK